MTEIKKLLENNLSVLSSMSIPEYTLYRKWVEINTLYKKENNNLEDLLFGGSKSDGVLPTLEKSIKKSIWIPTSLDEYKNVVPKIILANSERRNKIWNILRIFCHRMVWNQSPGRLLKFYVIDENTNKYIGFFSLGSDFIGVGGRDAYIGWTQDQKLKQGMLNHTAMGSTIAATQPLGYNYLGGKLISLMVCSDVVEKIWNKKFKENLAGITTTSLYGGFSQYNRLSYWRKCKTSEGKAMIEPSEDVYIKLREWFRENYPDEFKEATTIGEGKLINSHPKNKILDRTYRKLGVKPPENNAPRGTYFCSLYENTLNFLSMKDKELGNKKFDNSVKSLTEIWKNKYASKRVESLINKDNIKNETLFYDEMIGIDWESAKNKFLKD